MRRNKGGANLRLDVLHKICRPASGTGTLHGHAAKECHASMLHQLTVPWSGMPAKQAHLLHRHTTPARCTGTPCQHMTRHVLGCMLHQHAALALNTNCACKFFNRRTCCPIDCKLFSHQYHNVPKMLTNKHISLFTKSYCSLLRYLRYHLIPDWNITRGQ